MPTSMSEKDSPASSPSKFGPEEALEALSGSTMGSLCSYVKIHGSEAQQEEVQVLIDKILANKQNRRQKKSSVQSLTPNQWNNYRQELYEICGDWLWLHATNYWRTNIATRMCVPIRLLQLVLHVDYPPSIGNKDLHVSEQAVQRNDGSKSNNTINSNMVGTGTNRSPGGGKVKGNSKKQRFLNRTMNSNNLVMGDDDDDSEDASTNKVQDTYNAANSDDKVSMGNSSDDKKRKAAESADTELETGARRSGRTRFKPDTFQPGKAKAASTFKETTKLCMEENLCYDEAYTDADVNEDEGDCADGPTSAITHINNNSDEVHPKIHSKAAERVKGEEDKEKSSIGGSNIGAVNSKSPQKHQRIQKSSIRKAGSTSQRSAFQGVLYKASAVNGMMWSAQASVPGATRTRGMHSGNFTAERQAAYAVDLARCFLYYHVATGVQALPQSADPKDPNMGLKNMNVLSLKQGIEFWKRRPDIVKFLMPGMNVDIGNRKRMREVIQEEVLLNASKVWEDFDKGCNSLNAAIGANGCRQMVKSRQKEEEPEQVVENDKSNDTGKEEELSSNVCTKTFASTTVEAALLLEGQERASGASSMTTREVKTTNADEEKAKEDKSQAAPVPQQNYTEPKELALRPENHYNETHGLIHLEEQERTTERRDKVGVVQQQEQQQHSEMKVRNDIDIENSRDTPHNLAVANNKMSDSQVAKSVMSLPSPTTAASMAASYDRTLAQMALSSDVPHSPFPWRLALYFALRGTKRDDDDNRQLSKLLCGVIQTILASRAVRMTGANGSVNAGIMQPNMDLMAYAPDEQATLNSLLQIMTQVPEHMNWPLFKCSIANLLQQMDGSRYPPLFQLIPSAFCSSANLTELNTHLQQLQPLSQVQIIKTAQQLVGNALHVHDYHTSCMEAVRGFKTFSMWAHHTSRGSAGEVEHLIPSLGQAFGLRLLRGDNITATQSPMNSVNATLPLQQHRHMQHVHQNQRHMPVVVNAMNMPPGHRGHRLASQPIGDPARNGQPLVLRQSAPVGMPQNQPHVAVRQAPATLFPFPVSQMQIRNRMDLGSRQMNNNLSHGASHGVGGNSVRVMDSLVGILDGANSRVPPKVDDSQNTNSNNKY